MNIVGTSFCQYNESTGKFKNFYPNEVSVRLCGGSLPIVEVNLVEVAEEDAEYFGWQDKARNDCRYIYDNVIAVQMCDMYFFEKEIEEGIGRIVPLRVEIIKQNSNEGVVPSE